MVAQYSDVEAVDKVLALASLQLNSSTSFCEQLSSVFGVKATHQLNWRHCTNSRRCLHRALVDDTVHMIEADVCLGELLESSTSASRSGPRWRRKDLVMAHYPTTRSSDLCLEDFLTTIMRHNAAGVGSPKGIKLDFKQLSCVSSGVAKLVHLHERLSADFAGREKLLLPAVFLNGDVVRGPCFAPSVVGRWQEPLPADAFVEAVCCALSSCERPHELNAVLSLGWTMGLHIRGGTVLEGKMVNSMLAALPLARSSLASGYLRHISFAVSAALAPSSEDVLRNVLAASGAESSLTFFTPTFGRGLTRKEAEALLAYPLCPPYGLFLDIRLRRNSHLALRVRPRVLDFAAVVFFPVRSLIRCMTWLWPKTSYNKLKHDEFDVSPVISDSEFKDVGKGQQVCTSPDYSIALQKLANAV